eukprot:3326449-Prymnesium_polylepis.2
MVGAAVRRGPSSKCVLGVRGVLGEKQDASCDGQGVLAVPALSTGEIDPSSTGEPTPRDMKDSIIKGSGDPFELLRQALDVEPFGVAALEMVCQSPHGGRGSVLGAERSGEDGGA